MSRRQSTCSRNPQVAPVKLEQKYMGESFQMVLIEEESRNDI